MTYSIRPLKITDYDNLIKMWQRCDLPLRPLGRDSYEAISKELGRKETCFLGMFVGDNMIGSAIATSDGRKGWINRLAIIPEYRRRGLALKLIDECEKFLHSLGLKVIAALIEPGNKPSFATFEKAGYIFGEGIAYYSKRSSAED